MLLLSSLALARLLWLNTNNRMTFMQFYIITKGTLYDQSAVHGYTVQPEVKNRTSVISSPSFCWLSVFWKWMESTNDEESSHKVVVERAKKLLSELLTDPFLSDISSTASHDEVSSQLALEQGRAVTVHVRRFDDQVLCKLHCVMSVLNKFITCMSVSIHFNSVKCNACKYVRQY